MILDVFVGPPSSPKNYSRHLNGNKLDNRLENLCWGTAKENAQDRLDHGQQPKGSEHYLARLTEAEVADIRCRRVHGESTRKLAKFFSVSRGTIRHIIKRRTWRHVVP